MKRSPSPSEELDTPKQPRTTLQSINANNSVLMFISFIFIFIFIFIFLLQCVPCVLTARTSTPLTVQCSTLTLRKFFFDFFFFFFTFSFISFQFFAVLLQVCSVTLTTVNVYGCLVCGKFFQGVFSNKFKQFFWTINMIIHRSRSRHSGLHSCTRRWSSCLHQSLFSENLLPSRWLWSPRFFSGRY